MIFWDLLLGREDFRIGLSKRRKSKKLVHSFACKLLGKDILAVGGDLGLITLLDASDPDEIPICKYFRGY